MSEENARFSRKDLKRPIKLTDLEESNASPERAPKKTRAGFTPESTCEPPPRTGVLLALTTPDGGSPSQSNVYSTGAADPNLNEPIDEDGTKDFSSWRVKEITQGEVYYFPKVISSLPPAIFGNHRSIVGVEVLHNNTSFAVYLGPMCLRVARRTTQTRFL